MSKKGASQSLREGGRPNHRPLVIHFYKNNINAQADAKSYTHTERGFSTLLLLCSAALFCVRIISQQCAPRVYLIRQGLPKLQPKELFLLSACTPCANNNKHVICKIVYFQSKICTAHWQNKSTGAWIILIFFLFKELRAQREKEEEALVIISKCYAKKKYIKRGSA
jgi:hypothetical protein